MNFNIKNQLLGASLVAATCILAACGGSSGTGSQAAPEVINTINVSQASLVSSASKITGGNSTRSGKDFSFPTISDDGGSLSMTIPSGQAPLFQARRTARSGGGNVVGFGDPVILKYDMFSWTTGELVESSSEFDIALTVTSGVVDDMPIPPYLAQSLSGRSLGDVVQVVLPVNAEGLPEYLDPNDAYIVLVELM